MGMGKGGQTIGYHYLGSILFGLGRGAVNCLTHIKVGEKIAWEGGLSTDEATAINAPDLFGGEKKEGGIQGLFRSFMGKPDQVLAGASGLIAIGSDGPNKSAVLPDIKTTIGGPFSELRGRHVVWYDGLLSSMNPYIKTWWFRRWRTTAGWHNDDPWYPALATIFLKEGRIRAMNPSHIIYQVTTDPAWGRGRSPSELDENSFIVAANTLCTESLGLCIEWQRSEEVGTFISSVLDHIAGVLYTDRETGLINLKLIRDDYDPDDLPHFQPNSGLLSIREDDSGSSEAMVDEVIVEGKDPITDQAIEGRAHNLAVRRFREGSTTTKLVYKGLPTIELCNRVAERNRNAAGAGLRKFEVRLDRSGFRIHPGAVFKVSYAPRGLSGIVLRAGEIDDSDMIRGEIIIKCTQDVYSLPLTSFVTPVENTYDPEAEYEALPAEGDIFEASYRDLYRRLDSTDLAAIGEGEAMVGLLVDQPSNRSVGYDAAMRASGEPSFATGNDSFFTANAVLVGDITATATDLVVTPDSEWEGDEIVGSMLWVDGEYMLATAWDEGTTTMTVKRGCVDTWPAAHLSGVRVWAVDDDIGSDRRTYSETEVVEAKALTRTSRHVLDQADADTLSITVVARPFRPYPPADVTVDGNSIYSTYETGAEPVVDWVERNRLTQADTGVGFFDATVAAEASTTYEIDVYNDDPDVAPVNTYAGVTRPWTYDTASMTADGNLGVGLAYARIYSVRDGVRSLMQAAFPLIRDTGYSYGYGMNYGGA